MSILISRLRRIEYYEIEVEAESIEEAQSHAKYDFEVQL